MKPRIKSAFVSLVVIALSPSAQADTYNWNGLTTGGATGTSNTWDTATANWTGFGTTWPATTTTDDDAVFAGTAGTVTIATGGVSANSLTFSTTGYAIGGAALTLNGTTPTLTAGTGISATLSSVISGAAGLTKAGEGILTLSAANNFTGVTNINAGTLKAGNAAALGSNVDGTTIAGGTLDVGGLGLGTEIVTISGTGVGGLGAIVNSGGEQQNAVNRLVLAGDATIGGSGRWDMRLSSPTLDMGAAGPYTLTKTGPNYIGWVKVATVTNPGNIIINQGELNLTQTTNLGGSSSNSVTVNNTGTLGMYQSSVAHGWTLNLTTGSTLRGENGTGTQNTWAGPVNVAGEVTLRADGVLTLSNTVSGTANLTKLGGSTATVSGSLAHTGNLTVNGGTLTVSGSLAHTGDLTLISGTTNLSGTSSFTGTTTLNSATLALNYATSDTSKLPDLSPLILAGGTLSMTGGTHPEVVDSTTLKPGTGSTITATAPTGVLVMNTIEREAAASVNFNAAGIATTDNSNDANGILGTWATVSGTTPADNNWAINSTGNLDAPITALTDFVLTSAIFDAATSYQNKHVNVDSVQTPDAAISPLSLIFNVAAANTLTLQGTNSLATGGIFVGSSVGSFASVITGGNLTGPASGELVINQRNTASPLTIASTIVDNTQTKLLKLGTGTAILTGTHSYTGSTTVGTGGTLQLGDGYIDGTIASTSGITLYGNLTYNNASDLTHSIPLSGTGTFTKTGSAMLAISNSNTGYTGPVSVSGGTLRVTQPTALGDAGKIVSISGGGYLELATDSPISDYILNLPSSSVGTVTLNRANSGLALTQKFAGFTLGNSTIDFAPGAKVNSGTPVAQFDSLTLSAGVNGIAKLNPTDVNLSIGTMQRTGNSAGNISLGGSSTGNIVTGVMSNGPAGAYTVNKVDSGTWELAGTNTYTGTTNVDDGILILSGNRTANAGLINVGGVASQTGTLNIQGDIAMGASVLSVGWQYAGAIGIVNHTAGTVTFSGSGNAVLIGRTAEGVTGTYNLSGGTLIPVSSTANRGVMIGVNVGVEGNPINATFNLSGTGFLNNTGGAGTLQVVRGDSASSYQNSTYNQTGGTSNHKVLLIGGNGANGANSTATFSVTGGTFTADAFAGLSAGNNVASTMTIGGTADVTLPAFPTVRGVVGTPPPTVPSTATLYFDGGVLKPTANSTAYLGELTKAYIQDGGAKFNTNGKDITVSQILEKDDSSPGGGLTKEGDGTLVLTGANTYTGATTVTGGTLLINGDQSSAIGAVQVNAATLGGTGTVGGAVTVVSGATIAPGTDGTIESLNIADDTSIAGIFACDVSGNTTDSLLVAGNLDLTGSTLDINQITPGAAGTYVIASYTGIRSGALGGSLPAGYSVTYDDTNKKVELVIAGYSSWAATYADNQASDLDYDHDGVDNGIEYFLNATTAGTTASPSSFIGNTATWNNGGKIPFGDYGTQFYIQTSPDLVNWTKVPANDPKLSNTNLAVSYTLNGTGKQFVRLVVIPN